MLLTEIALATLAELVVVIMSEVRVLWQLCFGLQGCKLFCICVRNRYCNLDSTRNGNLCRSRCLRLAEIVVVVAESLVVFLPSMSLL